jgi:hypothetical protein
MVFNSILQNFGSKPKIFWVKWGTKHTLRPCLVSHGIQNTKWQLLWNDEIQNAKIFTDVFSFIQNAKFFMGWVKAFWLFGFFFFAS